MRYFFLLDNFNFYKIHPNRKNKSRDEIFTNTLLTELHLSFYLSKLVL